MPICITGMGRSGTSMVARLLHLSGIYMGDERDLMPADIHNTDGYWEHLNFVAINDTILNALGGAWDCPPRFCAGWERGDQFARLHAQAVVSLEEFAGREPWGWKDPRTSLTLAFWQAITPDMKVVICLRNPLEVALSLAHRQAFSYALSLNLWTIYNRSVLAAVPPERRIISHYNAYFHHPEVELARVLAFLGVPVSETTLAQCRASVATDLRHHGLTMQDLLHAQIAPDVLNLYSQMCGEAGWRNDRPITPLAATFSVETGHASHAMTRDAADTSHTAPLQRGDGPRLDVAANDVGRLDRRALEAIMLRQQLDHLNGRIATRDDVIRELRIALAREREEGEARKTRLRATSQRLATAMVEQQQLSDQVTTLRDTLASALNANDAQAAWARTLEQELIQVQAAYQAQSEWANELSQRLHGRELSRSRRISRRHGRENAP